MAAASDASKFAGYLGFAPDIGRWRVRSIDVSHGGVLHKMTYPDLPLLDAVFMPPLAQVIEDCLARMDREGEMYSDPTRQLALEGVTFAKLRMHTTHNAQRGYEGSFWFAGFTGQPLMALTQYADLVRQMPSLAKVDTLAIEAIDRVIIPALNVVCAVRGGLRSEHNVEVFEDHADRLIRQADDLVMYAELVKRLIRSQRGEAIGDRSDLAQMLSGSQARLIKGS